MEKKSYVAPTMEVVELEEDVILTSGEENITTGEVNSTVADVNITVAE